ncbi:calcitonin gene-related peptide type 1 receptor-like [Schistocerca nitens]|uniref:calcitonin gene-related peptide type 1 receptor-like n=1 Tax=Schistocerca nitens TaxID=7011 RepID=UPI002118F719|nr:calcitonin gene-related peptide type 1 receptor-like [Schistocerca nitens]
MSGMSLQTGGAIRNRSFLTNKINNTKIRSLNKYIESSFLGCSLERDNEQQQNGLKKQLPFFTKVACQALHVALQYLMLANYLWMFCEGLHLHLALVVVFVKDESAMRWFLLVGWGLPLPIAALYVGVRMSRPADVLQCWMHDSTAQWVLTVPVCLSLVASAVFLVNVVRVLLTKLHTHSANPAPVGMRKAARAAAILVPLFGLQHVLLPFRPAPHEPGERAYQLISAVLVSLQGLCVSCLFCFANVDVHGALRPLLCRLWGRQRAASMHTQSRDVCAGGGAGGGGGASRGRNCSLRSPEPPPPPPPPPLLHHAVSVV